MRDGYKRVWKYKGLLEGKPNWIRSHLLWVKAGDTVFVEGDGQTKMATSDTYNDGLRGPKFQFVSSSIEIPNV